MKRKPADLIRQYKLSGNMIDVAEVDRPVGARRAHIHHPYAKIYLAWWVWTRERDGGGGGWEGSLDPNYETF